MFKKLLLSLVVIIGLILIVAYFLPRDFRLSKSVVINAPRETVYDYVRFLKNQEKYSIWVMADPNVKMTYTGTDGTVGATSSWVSDDKNVGVGEQEIKALVPNEKMTVEIRFKKPMEGTNYADTTLESVGENQTKVTNTFYGSNPYPFNIMCQFMDMLVGGDMQKNMENLKKNLENNSLVIPDNQPQNTATQPSPSQLQIELNQAQKLWAEKGPKTYTVTQTLGCFECPSESTLPYTYTVNNGSVDMTNITSGGKKPTTKPELFPKFHTIPEAFAIIQYAIRKKYENIQVSYDKTLGYPRFIAIDESVDIADEEQSLTFEIK